MHGEGVESWGRIVSTWALGGGWAGHATVLVLDYVDRTVKLIDLYPSLKLTPY